MAKINVTNQTMFHREQEFLELQGTLLGLFLNSKMRQFYNDNHLKFKTLNERRKKIFEEFYFVEPTGKLKMESEDKEAKPLLQDGKTHEEFKEKLNAFLIEENTLEI